MHSSREEDETSKTMDPQDLLGSLEYILMLDTLKSNNYALKNTSFKKDHQSSPKFHNEITQEVLNAAGGGIFLYKTPNQAYQLLEDKVFLKLDWAKNKKTKSSLKKTVAFADEGSSNSDTDKIMARMDAMTLKMDAQSKELQSNAKKENSILMMMMTHLCHVKRKLNSCKLSVVQYDFFVLPGGKGGRGTWEVKVRLYGMLGCSIDVIDEILEDFDALLEKGSKILHSIKGTLLEEEIVAEFNEFMAMTVDENFDSESDTEEPTFEKITINTNYKIKTSLEEPPMDLELKPLSDNLKPVVQKQRRLSQNMQEVVKKEIMKLLDTGIIYPIADSPWVSHIHCILKKGGITVVTNKNDKLVSTRTVMG
nr:reverse transcriptase domain-containing protein [Tanacetum cinerariifolium]